MAIQYENRENVLKEKLRNLTETHAEVEKRCKALAEKTEKHVCEQQKITDTQIEEYKKGLGIEEMEELEDMEDDDIEEILEEGNDDWKKMQREINVSQQLAEIITTLEEEQDAGKEELQESLVTVAEALMESSFEKEKKRNKRAASATPEAREKKKTNLNEESDDGSKGRSKSKDRQERSRRSREHYAGETKRTESLESQGRRQFISGERSQESSQNLVLRLSQTQKIPESQQNVGKTGGEESQESQSLLDNDDPFYTADAQQLCPNEMSDEEEKENEKNEEKRNEERYVDDESEETGESGESVKIKDEILTVEIPTVEIADLTQDSESEPPCVSTPKEGHNLRDRDRLRPPPAYSAIATSSQVDKAVGPFDD